MGNWHCVPSGCADVVYREYLPPVVRWRYPGEGWQEIDGDNYSIIQEQWKCPVQYTPVTRFKPGNNDPWTEYKTASLDFRPPFTNLLLIIDRSNATPFAQGFPSLTIFRPTSTSGTRWNNLFRFTCPDRNGVLRNQSVLAGNSGRLGQTQVMEFLRFERADGLPDNCGDCIFTITKNEQTVHEETRSVCPEVEKLPCRLDEKTKSIRIDKLPYLSAIEIAKFAYDAIKVPGVPFPLPNITPIPPECLNIYRQEIFDLLPEGDPDEPDQPLFGDFIQQICSAPGCPPPEYQVICDCDCEECPDGTCAVNCDGHICCYDDSGRAVKQIAAADYCGGTV